MHSIAFKIGSLTIHWYGILVAMGFLAGLWTASRRARLVGITPEQVFDLGPWLIIGGIAGGRILYVISYWHEEFAAKPFPEIFMIQHGGLVFYGGLIGAIMAAIFYLALEKTAALENGRRARAEHRAGLCLWPHRLPDERLLLRPRLSSALGHPFSSRTIR